jgi:exodeoxyribonuclease-3
MKVATWNCNSVRARKDRLLGWLEARRPEVACLQELKCLDAEFPTAEVEALGYRAATFGQKTYNGVAILAREPLADVRRGFDDGEPEDPQARLISATVGPLCVYSVYAPNGQSPGTPAYEAKLAWYGRLRRLLDRRHRAGDRLILCGDWNVAPEPVDVHDPAAWEGQIHFSLPERAALKDLMAFGLRDVFRQHRPADQKFTWWDYRQLAFPKNKGLRIDHLLATESVAAACTEVEIDRDMRKGQQPSDHAPVWAEIDLTRLAPTD